MPYPSIPESFRAMDVLRNANLLEQMGKRICHLEVGQPRYPMPPILLQELASRQHDLDIHGYTSAWGRDEFKKAIGSLYQSEFGLDISHDKIAATTGSSAAFQMLFQWGACLGKCLALTNPGYPAYRNIAQAVGLSTTPITLQEDQFELRLKEVEEAFSQQPFDMLLVANPSNPTGGFTSYVEMKRISNFCASHGILLISDEIYGSLVHDGQAFTLAGEGDHVVVVNSFSKSFGMPGWRIGWLLAPSFMLASLEPFAQNFHICPPTISQIAGELAVAHRDQFAGLIGHMARNREIMLRGLRACPQIFFCPPSGAFYVYARLLDHPLANDSMALSKALLEQVGVALTPGIDFDPIRGQQWFRMSYAGNINDVEEGVSLLTNWIDTASRENYF
ncbi:MAG: pyridoxal phosphate-dependent aminotransferase [SAR116 cluster bacterium]|nr:MAG: pyridoxal phosphate-dependent aminotransferase [SAR116 cluster bacterium]HCJ61294.1 1-aminocyclopropane-1-carboxylate deaminase [Alphaproteobacteria bacterium]